MILCTTWKSRPLAPEQMNRLMAVWAKLEAKQAEDASVERLCWYLFADGSGGLTVVKAHDPEAATALVLETSLALDEFLEVETKVAVDLDTAMPIIGRAMEHIGS